MSDINLWSNTSDAEREREMDRERERESQREIERESTEKSQVKMI